MPDLYLKWHPETGTADWSPTGSDLETSVLLSLFTDAAASPDFVPMDGDRRGWWATAFESSELGSQLWELERAKKTDAALALATGTAQRALQWMIDDGVAVTIDVAGEWQGTTIALVVTIAQPDGTVNVYRYGWAWSALGV